MGVAAIAPQLLHDLASLTVFYVDYTYTMHLLRSSPAAVLTNVPPRSTTLRFRPAAWVCRSVCAPLADVLADGLADVAETQRIYGRRGFHVKENFKH